MADTNSTALALKIVFVFIFFFLALAAGIIPAKSTRCKANQTLLGVANSFAAGVFMAIAFMHILPEAVGDYSEIMEDGKEEVDSDDDDNGPFPLPYLLYFIGYTFILIVDRVVFDSHGVFDEGHHGEHGHDAEDPAEQKLIDVTKRSILQTQQVLSMHSQDPALIKKSMALQKESIREGMRSYLSKADKFSVRMSHAIGNTPSPLQEVDEQQELFVDNTNLAFEGQKPYYKSSPQVNGSNSQNATFTQKDSMTISLKHGGQGEHQMTSSKNKKKCNFTPFILMLGLSMHSLFEGIALGLQKETQNVVNILIAISLHKWAASMSLGISLSKTFENQFKKIFMLIVMFSSATPIGIILGIFLGEAPPIVDVIFSCLAGGTFVYIACSEVIVEEFSLPGGKWLKLLSLILGATVITCLWFIPGS